MPRLSLALTGLTFALLLAADVRAEQNWMGARIMPKDDNLQICSEPGGYAKATAFDIAWPATVEKTDGRWLKIRDDGGYARNGIVGWVYADDVLRFEDAEQHFADKISESPTRWLYWLDGICFETNDEPGLALADYKSATDSKSPLPADNRLDDAEIRMGRLLAANQYAPQPSQNTDIDGANDWYQCFKSAQSMNANRPILYLEWGNAYRLLCKCAPHPSKEAQANIAGQPGAQSGGTTNTESGSKPSASRGNGQQPGGGFSLQSGTRPPKAPSSESVAVPQPAPDWVVVALDQYNEAEQRSPRWWNVPLARAELLLNSCTREDDKELAPKLRDDVEPAAVRSMLQTCGQPVPSAISPASVTKPPAQGGAAPADVANADSNQPKCDKACRDALLAAALHFFDRAIALQPKLPDAYRDRAEVLLLQSRLAPARQSAMTACTLADFRGSASLRMLAQICARMSDYESAQNYGQQAAVYESNTKSRQLLFRFCNNCGALEKMQTTADVVLTSTKTSQPGQGGFMTASNKYLKDHAASKNEPAANDSPPPGFVALPFLGGGQ